MTSQTALSLSRNKLENASDATWKSLTECVKGETKYVIDDYKAVERMNESVVESLKLTGNQLNKIGCEVETLNKKCDDVEAYLREIDTICEKIDRLESVAVALDTYTKTLEAKYKQLLKQ